MSGLVEHYSICQIRCSPFCYALRFASPRLASPRFDCSSPSRSCYEVQRKPPQQHLMIQDPFAVHPPQTKTKTRPKPDPDQGPTDTNLLLFPSSPPGRDPSSDSRVAQTCARFVCTNQGRQSRGCAERGSVRYLRYGSAIHADAWLW